MKSKLTKSIFAVSTVLLATAISCPAEETPIDYNAGMMKISSLFSKDSEHASEEAIDFAGIEEVYNTVFASLVNTYDPSLDADIKKAIEKGKLGELVDVQKQWVVKGLQRAIYHTALRELEKAAQDGAAFLKAENLFKCTEPVMDRRGKWLETGSEIKNRVRNELSLIKENPAEAQEHINIIKMTMTQVYFLSVLWEVDGLEKARGYEGDLPKVKQAEGILYFKVLEPFIADAALRKKIAAEFQKDPNDIDTVMIKKSLAQAMPDVWDGIPRRIRDSIFSE
ncbi:MAG: hypothetical protein MUC65_01900 [Pontiellaceae bacterium]|nr:hypothetical protein [Pontiellaceae bacterium]